VKLAEVRSALRKATAVGAFADLASASSGGAGAFEGAGLGPLGGRGRPAFLPGRGARQYPLVNVYDNGETFTVEALAPGLDPEKIDLSVLRNTLTIAGDKPAPQGIAPERIHRIERAAGRFVRTVELAAEADPGPGQSSQLRGWPRCSFVAREPLTHSPKKSPRVSALRPTT
jgi:hypothetical protein